MTETTTSPAQPQPRKILVCIAHSRGLAPEESPHNSTSSSSRSSTGQDATTLNSVMAGNSELLRSAGAATAAGRSSYLWDNGQDITFCFLDGSDHQKRKVEEVMQEWTWYANLAFVKKDDCDGSAAIRISFRGKGSWSYMGKAALAFRKGPTMQYDCIWDTKDLLTEERTTILHEFGHALGLLHEHQSPARPFEWNVSKVFASYRSLGFDDDFIHNNVLYMFDNDEVTNYSTFDPCSIMAYDMKPELNSAGITVDVNNELSDMDKAYMVINYPRPKPHERAPKWKLGHALEVAGVPKQVSRPWKDLPASNIRRAFTEWQAAERAKERRLNVKYVRVRISRKDKTYFYKIVCHANLPEFKRHSQVGRRHSEFEEFRDALAAQVKNIPLLPGTKDSLWSSWPCYRQRKLLEWLQLLSEHDEFSMLKEELRRFLQEEDYTIGP